MIDTTRIEGLPHFTEVYLDKIIQNQDRILKFAELYLEGSEIQKKLLSSASDTITLAKFVQRNITKCVEEVIE